MKLFLQVSFVTKSEHLDKSTGQILPSLETRNVIDDLDDMLTSGQLKDFNHCQPRGNTYVYQICVSSWVYYSHSSPNQRLFNAIKDTVEALDHQPLLAVVYDHNLEPLTKFTYPLRRTKLPSRGSL